MNGLRWALLAAICNATIGIASEFGFSNGALFSSIAFYKCFGAFLVLAGWKYINKESWSFSKQDIWQGALLGFLGVFCLYYFETWAFSYAPIPVVSFTIYASGVSCILLSWFFLKESLGIKKVLSVSLILFGIFLLKQIETQYSVGLYLALLAGLGYSLYLFLLKLFNKSANIDLLVLIFFFGSIFLSVPWVQSGSPLPTLNQVPSLIWLILVPTIFGFYCTNKAIEKAPAGVVQIVETSDPVFASLLGFIILGHNLEMGGWLGCVFVLCGLLLLAKHQS